MGSTPHGNRNSEYKRPTPSRRGSLLMPPRGSNTPNNKSRRKPGPPVSSAWIWMIIGLGLVLMLLLNTFDKSIEIPYSTFVKLIYTNSDNIKKISFGTNDRIFGELADLDKLPTMG